MRNSPSKHLNLTILNSRNINTFYILANYLDLPSYHVPLLSKIVLSFLNDFISTFGLVCSNLNHMIM